LDFSALQNKFLLNWQLIDNQWFKKLFPKRFLKFRLFGLRLGAYPVLPNEHSFGIENQRVTQPKQAIT
jgi:hypothetical protein